MNKAETEIYSRRAIETCGIWEIGSLTVKVYGLLPGGKRITKEMLNTAKQFMDREVSGRIAETDNSNNLGFVIIHPGEKGLTVSANWWAQGSVLCQHNYRKDYSASEAMDTITRPVVACVWELQLINAERVAWQQTMMCPDPDPMAYLRARAMDAGDEA